MHGPGYWAFPHKLRTGPWQLFGGTTTHHALLFDETASNNPSSRSCTYLFFCHVWTCFFVMYGHVFSYLKEFCLWTKIPKNWPKINQKNSRDYRDAPHPLRIGRRPFQPPKVDAKCLAAVVLDNQDRALRERAVCVSELNKVSQGTLKVRPFLPCLSCHWLGLQNDYAQS